MLEKLFCETKTISTITLILVLITSVTFAALQVATAQEPSTKETFPFINAVPNPVGVNQEVLLHVGILTAYLPGYGWKGLEVLVTRPDGTQETLGPYNTDPTGGTGAIFVPEQVGNYTLQTHFPEQVLEVDIFRSDTGTLLPAGTVMKESYSDTLELAVQQEAVPGYPGHSLPSEYWTRPIDSQLYEWNVIAGNWLRSPPNLIAPYNEEAPETAHILWAKPLRNDVGALVGGAYDSHGYTTGDAYENEWENSIILNGILYYNKYHDSFTYDGAGTLYPGAFDAPPGVVAVDLHTGEELWYKDDIRINFGQIYYYSSPNQHGAHDYLISTAGSTWNFYKASTGDWEFTIGNVSSGYQYYGPNGEIMILNVNTANGWMSLWNNTAIPELLGGSEGAAIDMWRPYKITVDGNDGYEWNVTIPTDLGSPGTPLLGGANYMVYEDRVVGISWNQSEVTVWGLSLVPGHEGTLLFKETWAAPPIWKNSDLTIQYAGATSEAEAENGVIALWSKEQRQFFGFSTENGKYLWTTDSEIYLDAYGWGAVEHTWCFAYGKLYSTGVGGIVYCRDLETGKTLWTYHAKDYHNEYLFANSWWQWFTFITDGKIYMGHAEHSPIDPKPRGGPFICLDATTGDVIWRADGLFRQTRWGGRAIIGDSIIATMDTYDGRVYAIGKGPSAITVEKPQAAAILGSAITIQGTVMDVSPGTEDPALQMRFPNGVPAVSDDNMSDWMLYVYKQFERPADATGVTVKLEAVDPDGEYANIGTTTSDSYGNYGFGFCPEKAGTYMIIATFEGSGAYYGSTATTYLTVTEPVPVETDLGPLEHSVSGVESNVSNLTTYVLVILAFVIIAIILAVYSILKPRK
jgi:hypothetical protein